uniref:Putative secreted protein n=1 Tax=Ixodes ricinus TaxID=34613 RepID=A0A6B0U7M2_IXORI
MLRDCTLFFFKFTCCATIVIRCGTIVGFGQLPRGLVLLWNMAIFRELNRSCVDSNSCTLLRFHRFRLATTFGRFCHNFGGVALAFLEPRSGRPTATIPCNVS